MTAPAKVQQPHDEQLAAWVREQVARAPRFTEQQRRHLGALLSGGGTR